MAEFHRSVPKDPRENLKWRRHLLTKATGDEGLQEALVTACKSDIVFYVNSFVFQYNPDHQGHENTPFVTWDFQDDLFHQLVRAIETGEDVLIEKSRKMGASWACLLAFDWFARFRPYQKFLIISRSAEAVDKTDEPDALFWKLDHVHDHLPGWLKRGRQRLKMSIKFAATHSVISGQASTGKAGVGGRATAMFIDEFSQIDEGYEVLQRTADTTKCRIFNGTHVSAGGNAFYDLSRRENVKKIQVHWSQHPDHNHGLYQVHAETREVTPIDPTYRYPHDFAFVTDGSPTGGPYPGLRSPWYDAECSRRSNVRAVAMDLDISPEGSASQFFNAIKLNDLATAYKMKPAWVGDLYYDQARAVPLALVPREKGPLKLWFNPIGDKVPKSVYKAGSDLSNGTGATPSTWSCIDAKIGEQVAEYATAHLPPELFAFVAVSLCRLFHDAEFAWEMAGPGVPFGKQVVSLDYLNIYFKTSEFDFKPVRSDKPGWYPERRAKRLLLEDLRIAIEQRKLLVRQEETYKEMMGYQYAGDSNKVYHPREEGEDPATAGENHGDRVISLALACMLARDVQTDSAAQAEVDECPFGSLAWRRKYHEERGLQAQSGNIWLR